jgi:hypothetical protein
VRIAALYSIHDASEGVLKDDTTPKKRALAELIEQRCGILARVILDCIDDLTFIQNQAIYAASGLGWPHIDEAKRVHHYDLVMFVTEWRDLMRGIEHPDWEQYRNIEPLRDTIKPWPWEHAKGALLRRWHKVLPVFAQEAQ